MTKENCSSQDTMPRKPYIFILTVATSGKGRNGMWKNWALPYTFYTPMSFTFLISTYCCFHKEKEEYF